MFDRTHVKAAFGKAAAHYDAQAELQSLIRTDALALAAQHWPQNAHILDIGCGTGAMASQARNQGLNIEITGVDIAFGMCEIAQKHLPTANASADSLPFKDQCFDGAFSSLMLQWAPNPLACLREIARVTKPRGRCVITSFTKGTLRELEETFATLDTTPHVNNFLEPSQLSALAAHAGFALLHAEEETITEYYSDVTSLMRAIKAIGAANKLATRSKGLMTPSRLRTLEARYREHFGSKKKSKNKGLPATWNAITLLLENRA